MERIAFTVLTATGRTVLNPGPITSRCMLSSSSANFLALLRLRCL